VAATDAQGTVTGEDSFESFVRARSDRLLRLAWLITGDWDDSRDSVQDALEAVLPRWPGLSATDRLDAYVRRCVVNACLDTTRRRGRSRPVAEPALLPSAPVGDDPASAVANADEAWRLCRGLPPVQRTAVVLRFYDDLSFADIGAALGCPEATARSHVHRAIAALRSRLDVGSTTEGRTREGSAKEGSAKEGNPKEGNSNG